MISRILAEGKSCRIPRIPVEVKSWILGILSEGKSYRIPRIPAEVKSGRNPRISVYEGQDT
jgi:hypothetical protein